MACFRFATGVANSWSIDSRAMSVTDQVTKWCVGCYACAMHRHDDARTLAPAAGPQSRVRGAQVDCGGQDLWGTPACGAQQMGIIEIRRIAREVLIVHISIRYRHVSALASPPDGHPCEWPVTIGAHAITDESAGATGHVCMVHTSAGISSRFIASITGRRAPSPYCCECRYIFRSRSPRQAGKSVPESGR